MPRDRELVLSRRKALMLAAVATSATACPQPCLSEPMVCLSRPPDPQVCLSAPQPMPACGALAITWIAFSGPSTALDAAANGRLDQLAQEVAAGQLHLVLRSRVYDDGHADTANILHEARLAAVEQGLVNRGIAAAQLTREPNPQPPVPLPEWQQITGGSVPLTQSGLIQLSC
jgi:hypothetical protein